MINITRILCQSCCDEASVNIIYECIECVWPLCDYKVNICKKCGTYLCDGCCYNHKKKCN